MQESTAPSPLAAGHPAGAEGNPAAPCPPHNLRPPLRLSNTPDRNDGPNSDDQNLGELL
jgi:hypothetical protein